MYRILIVGVAPPDDVKAQMSSPGTIKGSFKFCIAETGEVTEVKVLQPTPYRSYDEEIIRKMQTWKYRPYVADGKAVAVCSAVTFVFSQRS